MKVLRQTERIYGNSVASPLSYEHNFSLINIYIILQLLIVLQFVSAINQLINWLVIKYTLL